MKVECRVKAVSCSRTEFQAARGGDFWVIMDDLLVSLGEFKQLNL